MGNFLLCVCMCVCVRSISNCGTQQTFSKYLFNKGRKGKHKKDVRDVVLLVPT